MHRRRFCIGVSGSIASFLTAPAYAWPAEAQDAAAQLGDEQKEQFLLSAEILEQKQLKTGTTGSARAKLSDGRITHDAHVQDIDIYKPLYNTGSRVEANFRDSYKYNIAAYRLDRLINLRMVPVSVEREVDRKGASVTWWVDSVQMMEKDRFQKKIEPPNHADWNDQMRNARVFNELAYNTDANLGNVLITTDWQVRLVDFSRAFRTAKDLRTPKNLTRIDRRVYDGLKSLTAQTLSTKLGSVLRDSEINAVLARRDKIIKLFDQAIAEKGEADVICGIKGH
ncbi:MAG: hypothetical protein O2968_13855 [Acidobacteria bacterium]|nr:hypothetical protein [Acidobacteriota bacterium]